MWRCRCGPCKVMYPMLCKMAEEQKDVTFVKLNCNKYNKELGKTLGARTASVSCPSHAEVSHATLPPVSVHLTFERPPVM